MKKMLALAVVLGIAQAAALWWLIYSVASLPIVEKVGAKVKREVVEWSEEK